MFISIVQAETMDPPVHSWNSARVRASNGNAEERRAAASRNGAPSYAWARGRQMGSRRR